MHAKQDEFVTIKGTDGTEIRIPKAGKSLFVPRYGVADPPSGELPKRHKAIPGGFTPRADTSHPPEAYPDPFAPQGGDTLPPGYDCG